jgi:hypothetical protein
VSEAGEPTAAASHIIDTLPANVIAILLTQQLTCLNDQAQALIMESLKCEPDKKASEVVPPSQQHPACALPLQSPLTASAPPCSLRPSHFHRCKRWRAFKVTIFGTCTMRPPSESTGSSKLLKSPHDRAFSLSGLEAELSGVQPPSKGAGKGPPPHPRRSTLHGFIAWHVAPLMWRGGQVSLEV